MDDMPSHGGALDAAIARHGGARGDWLDLSTGINPAAWPVPAIPNTVWQRLPDTHLEQACLDAARACYGVPDGAAIVAAPGTQAIIQHLPTLIGPAKRIGLVDPTYNEYGRCLAGAGRQLVSLSSIPKHGIDCVVIGNPNNPDGRTVGAGHDAAALDALQDGGALIIADEAFADVAPDVSLVPQCGPGGLLVLRSFGKFFGLAGARLGFAIGAPGDIARLHHLLGPWAAPAPALFVAAQAMADTAWIAATRRRLTGDRQRLAGLLEAHGLAIVGQTDLFVLARHDRAVELAGSLARARILVRAFPNHPRWLRFGLPADDAGFARLDVALAEAL